MSNPRTMIKKAVHTAAVNAGRVLYYGAERPLPPPGEIHRVLVVKVWAIGEVVMATPALRAVRALFREAHITMLTGRAAYPVVELSPRFDEVRAVDEQIFLRPEPGRLLAFARELRQERYDMVISLHHAWQFGVFASLTGARHRVGFDRAGEGFAHTVKVKLGQSLHQVEEYFDLARAAGAAGDPGPLEVFADDADERYAEETINRLREAGKPVAFLAPGGGTNPRTRMPEKRWPADRYAELADMLAPDFTLALVGGPDDTDAGAALLDKLNSDFANLIGRTTIRQLYALLARADLFVGNDSAPMHLAAAVGAPTVAVFGPTDPALNGPWSARAAVIRHEQDCGPCYRDGYFPDCEDRRCLEDITAAEVYAATVDFLDTLDDK